jgi:hypothetical protein
VCLTDEKVNLFEGNIQPAMFSFKSAMYLPVLALLSSMVTAGIQLPALGAPGQGFSEVRRSIEGNSIWSGNSLRPNRAMEETHQVSVPFKDGRLMFTVMTSTSGMSDMETLEVQDVGTKVEFSREKGEGLSLVRQVWGEAIAADFAKSKYTNEITDTRFGTPAHFFKGERYGYQVGTSVVGAGGGRMSTRYTFTVFTLSGWESMVRFYQACNQTPDSWECKVTL